MPSMPSCPHKIRILSPRVAWAVCPAQALDRAMFYSLKELGNGNSKETICLAAGLDLGGEQMITWPKIFTLAPLMKSKKANSNVICKCGFILEDGIYLSWKKQLLRILINENLLAPQVLLYSYQPRRRSVRSILVPSTFHIARLKCYTPKFSGLAQKLTWCQRFGVQVLPKSGNSD